MADRPPEYPPHPCLHLFVLTPFSQTQDPPQHRPSSLSGLPMQPPENRQVFIGIGFFIKKGKTYMDFLPQRHTPLQMFWQILVSSMGLGSISKQIRAYSFQAWCTLSLWSSFQQMCNSYNRPSLLIYNLNKWKNKLFWAVSSKARLINTSGTANVAIGFTVTSKLFLFVAMELAILRAHIFWTLRLGPPRIWEVHCPWKKLST